jgi:hypothetical protein
MRLICIARGIYRTFISTRAGYRGHWVSGCDWRTDDEATPDNIHVLKCQRCSHYDIAWSWGSLAPVK